MSQNPETAELPSVETFQRWSQLMGRAQQLALEFWTKQDQGSAPMAADPLGMTGAWQAMVTAAAADPQKLMSAQTALWQDSVKLWQAFLSGNPQESPVATARDKRFSSTAWTENPAFDFLRQSALILPQQDGCRSFGGCFCQGLNRFALEERNALFRLPIFCRA